MTLHWKTNCNHAVRIQEFSGNSFYKYKTIALIWFYPYLETATFLTSQTCRSGAVSCSFGSSRWGLSKYSGSGCASRLGSRLWNLFHISFQTQAEGQWLCMACTCHHESLSWAFQLTSHALCQLTSHGSKKSHGQAQSQRLGSCYLTTMNSWPGCR